MPSQVLDHLQEVGLKVSLDKCQFCQPKVKYVGHIVSETGIATDPEKVEVVKHWKEPNDLKSLRSFLSFCSNYHRFIANYSHIVRPLTGLTKRYPSAQTGRKTSSSSIHQRPTSRYPNRLEKDGISHAKTP